MANPQVAPLLENWHAEGFIVSEANGRRSRDQGTLALGQKVVAGTVLGLALLGTTAVAAALGTNIGTSTFGTITVAAPAIPGPYVLRMESGTTFVVEDPNGREIGHGVLGAPFSAGGIGFTLTTGGVPTVSDSYTLTPAAGSGQWAVFDPTLGDGSEIAVAIALNDTDATAAAHAIGVLTRTAEVNASELVWGANVTTAPQRAAALAALLARGIVAR